MYASSLKNGVERNKKNKIKIENEKHKSRSNLLFVTHRSLNVLRINSPSFFLKRKIKKGKKGVNDNNNKRK